MVISKSGPVCRPQPTEEPVTAESTYINIFLSAILFAMCILATPSYFYSSCSFLLIFKKGQPFYILLIFVLITSFLNLVVAAVDGVGFWTSIPQCLVVGCFRTSLLMISSLLIAFVCVSRSVKPWVAQEVV